MNRFVKVARTTDFGTRKSMRVTIENVDIALFSVDGAYHAVQNDCPHQHFSALHDGILNGAEITCPMHGWTFDLASGKATIGGGRLKRYSLKVVGEDILVEVPNDEPDWAKK
ncbi:MAG: Rieske 2Fe-2S domain-containing protein [Ignavibacteriales bacterium]|nr:Rieske 2Fe-2S domain-containing protein [Ignavibacteriales bacterium]